MMSLKLPLSQALSKQAPPQRLPFALVRKLGELEQLSPSDHQPPVIPKPLRKRQMGIFADTAIKVSAQSAISYHQQHQQYARHQANDWQIELKTKAHIYQPYHLSQVGFIAIDHVYTMRQGQYQPLHNEWHMQHWHLTLLSHYVYLPDVAIRHYQQQISAYSAHVQHFHHCQSNTVQGVILWANPQAQSHAKTVLYGHCQHHTIHKAMPVPCRYYPLPPPPAPPVQRYCQVRPPVQRLPMRFQRATQQFLSSALPFALQCWHDDYPTISPNARSFIVHNTISATVAGIAITPLHFSIQTDMNSYCWQGAIDITAQDYHKIKAKLAVAHGNEPLITVNINGFLFSILAEEQSHTRQFLQQSYRLSGRSITARLGADYAQSQGGLLEQNYYASQIVQQQLNGLSVSVERWQIADWLIPARQYSVSQKTPIAVIADIAQACGGFIHSHAHEAKLSLSPKWKKPAWELATAVPDVVISLDVVQQINEQKHIQTRYNTVTLTSPTQGGIVYRQGENREQDAPSQEHVLYCDRDCIVPAGMAILSASGIHQQYRITLRWANKYHVALAKLGDIWQVNDVDDAWKGVVTGVSVEVRLENDVPTVWQTVSIDRYADV